MLHQYLLDLSIFTKDNSLERDVYIKGLLEVTIQGVFLMEIDAAREAFIFTRGVIGSTRRHTIVNKLAMIVL